MATIGLKNATLLLGNTVKISRIGIKQIPCVQVRCQENEYNNYLKMYFAKPVEFWALDTTGEVQLGDTVLIQPVDSSDRIASTVTHKINKTVMKFGSIIDPVTKKRIFQNEFMDKQDLRRELVNQHTSQESPEEQVEVI